MKFSLPNHLLSNACGKKNAYYIYDAAVYNNAIMFVLIDILIIHVNKL